MKELKILALTHDRLNLDMLAKFHLTSEDKSERLRLIKESFGIEELIYLNTCNRVEIIFTTPDYFCFGRIRNLFEVLTGDARLASLATEVVRSFEGREAVEHIMKVASSLDSMVIGEREIITQVRKAFEDSRDMGLSGDMLRLLMRKVIETAKTVYARTDIARKPVSVVSLAWHRFRAKRIPSNARILLVGAGQVMTNFGRFLAKSDFQNVTVANRTLDRATHLASILGGRAITLETLREYRGGFDVLITCTGAGYHIIDRQLYKGLVNAETDKKIVIDLALPQDLDPALMGEFDIDFTGMSQLKAVAEENLSTRARETHRCEAIIAEGLETFEAIYKERQVEVAMRQIPTLIKEIRKTAIGEVFANDLSHLDQNARATLDKVLEYMEKKYVSLPMKMAKEVLLNKTSRN